MKSGYTSLKIHTTKKILRAAQMDGSFHVLYHSKTAVNSFYCRFATLKFISAIFYMLQQLLFSLALISHKQ